jgi:glycosyltransferase involved in cell wall biosynthesis
MTGSEAVALDREVVIRSPVFDRAQLGELYRAADIFLLPSRWEGVPLAVLEAMAFANIVIATDVGAISEVVRNGRNGILVDSLRSDRDITTEMVNAVTSVLENPVAFTEMRERAAASAFEFSWSRTASLLAKAIDETLAIRKPAHAPVN